MPRAFEDYEGRASGMAWVFKQNVGRDDDYQSKISLFVDTCTRRHMGSLVAVLDFEP